MFIFKLFKWLFGVASGALSVLILIYLGLKNENWTIVTDEGHTVIDKTGGICIIVVWAVVGALFLLLDFLYKRSNKKKNDKE